MKPFPNPNPLPGALLLLISSLCFFPSPIRAGIFDVPQHTSTFDGLIDLGNLGVGDDNQGMVAAFGDMRGEKFLDLVYLSPAQSSLSLYTWHRPSYSFVLSPLAPLTLSSLSSLPPSTIPKPPSSGEIEDLKITNVVPGDWDYDGKLDLLVMWEEGKGWWEGGGEKGEVGMGIWKGMGKRGWASTPNLTLSSTLAQPFVIDSNGDMTPDLLGFPYDTSNIGGDKGMKLWRNRNGKPDETDSKPVPGGGQDLKDPFILSDPPLGMENIDCEFPDIHSNALIDLDGDCLADLFLMCKGPSSDRNTFQIWTNSKKDGFKLARQGDLPRGTKAVAFSDMDRDGTIDMVLTVCSNPSKCSISIAYNSQMPLCSALSDPTLGRSCRDVSNMCVPDPDFTFDLSSTSKTFSTFQISSILPERPHLITQDDSFAPRPLPVNVKIGDYNVDGYPDLLVLSGQKNGASVGTVSILESRVCDKRICDKGDVDHGGRRGFVKLEGKGAKALERIGDVRGMAWIDLDEDGSLDIMLQRQGSGDAAARKLTFIKNNYFSDAFFLKALVLNGACGAICPGTTAEGGSYRPYGVSYSGASFKFTILDPSGHRRATHVGQLPQTSYLSLLTPYSYFGLGRTNNYVESLFVGTTLHRSHHYLNIEGVIPNSQLIVNPPGKDSNRMWTKELYLRPGDWIPWVAIGLAGTMVLLAAIVGVLHLNEKREDENERKRKLHSINFAAL